MSNKKNKNVTCLVIGDPHFKHTNLDEMWEFSKKTIDIAEKLFPTFIVILGDTLDTHEIIRIDPRDAAEEWIDSLASIAKVYLIIGNHDMANPKEFLTKKHAFRSLKKWKSSIDGRLCVVDGPIYEEIKDKSFAFCPYVPKGMFKDALDLLLKEGETWEMVDCIFAHQEFKGGHQGAYEITDGDEWDEDYPPVINGHYHNEEIIGKNIFIPGTPIQHTFGDSSDKKVWLVTFDDDDNEEHTRSKLKKFDFK
jgi:DNA repair exonuclease SbcCD nuclease subunit